MITVIVNDTRSHQSAVVSVWKDLAVARVAGAAAALFGYDNVAAIDLQDAETDVVLLRERTLAEEGVEEGDCLEVCFRPTTGGV